MTEHLQYKILIIDDSRMNRIMLGRILNDAGYAVEAAEDGIQGREVANEFLPDLIMLDIQMPGENGFETLGKLKNNTRTAMIPVIFFSGLSDITAKVEGLESGAVDFITKPFDPAEVKARVKVHIKLSYAMKAVVESQKEKLKQIEYAQQQLLVQPEDMPEAKFYAKYLPLSDAGGDYYSAVRLTSSKYSYFLGDVSGHDLSTSYITAALNALLKQNCTVLNTPAEAMSMLNKVLCQTLESSKFLAGTYLQIDRTEGRASFINMGNPPLIAISANKEARLIIGKGGLLGMFENAIFSEYVFNVKKGERFIMFSDGILENDGDVWAGSINKLLDVAQEIAALELPQMVETLCERFVSSTGEISDDIAILAMEV